jgi:5S rRNA maturation endonuclease (ribonuclease M5)
MPDIEKVLDELKDKTIIVEGKKDAKALKRLGIENVIPINSRPLINIVEGLESGRAAGSSKTGLSFRKNRKSSKEIVILTDFDRQGRKLNSRLLSLLQSRRIQANSRLRHMMRGLGKTRIEDFAGFGLNGEGIAFKKRGDNYGKACANINKVHNKGKDKDKRSYRKTGRYRSCLRADRRPSRE